MPAPLAEADAVRILQVLDDCAASFRFPMLDNGYVYLAATRLSLHRSARDWALVIEVFGYSPPAGVPALDVSSFGTGLRGRSRESSCDAFSEFAPIEAGDWQDEELVVSSAGTARVRGREVRLPTAEECARAGVVLEEPRMQTFELCRFLAATMRDDVLATPREQRANVPPTTQRLLQLDDWHHPDIAKNERPSDTETFRQLAEVLETGDVGRYRPHEKPNTHWRNWPDAGTL